MRGVQPGVKVTDAQPHLGRALLQQGTLDLNGLKKWTRYASVTVTVLLMSIITYGIAQRHQSSLSKSKAKKALY